MSGLVIRSLYVIAAFGLVWLAAITHWERDHILPGMGEVVLTLILLPLVLVLVVWQLQVRLIKTLVRPKPIPAESSAEQSPKAIINNTLESWVMVASSIRSATGDSAQGLAEAQKQDSVNFDLDPELTDSNGFPVASARIKGIDTLAGDAGFLDWAQVNAPVVLNWEPEQLRAMMLGTEVLSELMTLVTEQFHQETQMTRVLEKKPQVIPDLHVLLLLPELWPVEDQKTALNWFKTWLLQQWPPAKLSVRISENVDVFQQLDSLFRLMPTEAESQLVLLAGCESNIGQHIIEQWEAQGRLSGNRQENPAMPGEGAAGILLAGTQLARVFHAGDQAVLHKPVIQQGGQAVPNGDRPLAELFKQVLETSGMAAEAIKFVAGDCGRTVKKLIELMAASHEFFPDLDPNESFFNANQFFGSVGGIGSLMALVRAHAEAVSGNAALCVNNAGDVNRAAVLVSPKIHADSKPNLNQ